MTWHANQSCTEFIGTVFPESEHPVLDPRDINSSAKLRLAAEVEKIGRLAIVPTNNLQDHLRLDDKG